MSEANAPIVEKQLILRSRLEDLTLVPPWLDGLASEYGIPAKTRFGMDLCLEEALSNVIRHGYRGEPDRLITVSFWRSKATGLTFTILDDAPPFVPDEEAEADSLPTSIEDVRPGSLGMVLMKKFATTVRYEPLAKGNRLTLGFVVE